MTIRDCRNFGGVVLTAAALVSITAGVAGAQDKCAAAEMTAVAKAFSGATSCAKKAVKNGQVDPAKGCMDAQEAKFDAAVAKAEAKGNCRARGIVTLTGTRLADFTDVVDALKPAADLCPPFICDCAASKVAAAGKLAADESKCEGTALKSKPEKEEKAAAQRTACYATARVKYNAAVAKAEKKGSCLTTGDSATIAGKINTTVAGAVARILPPSPNCKGQCLHNGAYSELASATCLTPVSFPPDSAISLAMCTFHVLDPGCGPGFCETSVVPPSYCGGGQPQDCAQVCFLPQSPISEVMCGGALQPGCGVGTCVPTPGGNSYCNDCFCYEPETPLSQLFCP